MELNKIKEYIPTNVFIQIPDVLQKFEINTPLRLAHFLAQCEHESNNFKAINENLNYSAKGLLTTFKKYFSEETAKLYEYKPEKIANIVYANRIGNGDKTSGDGWKYRGRGYIQLTGKDNYKAFSKTINENVVENPDLVSLKYPLLSAAWYWNSRNLNTLADKGSTELIVKSITKKVNGGTLGLQERIKNFNFYYSLLK